MQNLILVIQIIVSIILVLLVLVQTKGTGFGRSMQGAASFSRRGLERFVFRFTFVISAIFILASILQLGL